MASRLAGRDVDAVLFDVDGTLVDSNYLHVYAWMRAFAEVGIDVPSWRIHRDIGMDARRLIHDLHPTVDDDLMGRLKDVQSREYASTARLLRPIDGARNLLRQLASSGLLVVLATSAPPDELAKLRGVLDCDESIAAETNADDVEEAKPEPDIVHVALERIGVKPDRAAFVGDAVWDMKAARAAGLACIGVRTGGVAASELVEAGADLVCDSVAGLEGGMA
jgi:HAD superfamily hydrolase (TIGR01509 family)